MFFVKLKGRLSDVLFARAKYANERNSNSGSVFVFFAIVFLHFIFIAIAINIKSKQPDITSAPSFKMIYLSPQKLSVELEVDAPVVQFASTKAPIVPEIMIDDGSAPVISLDASPSYSLNGNPVFDPKFRQKLSDAQLFNRDGVKEYSGDWKESDGRNFIARGDGGCFVSMRKMDARERGTNWGGTRCGKTDSESMMDRINADLEARKHPLKAQ